VPSCAAEFVVSKRKYHGRAQFEPSQVVLIGRPYFEPFRDSKQLEHKSFKRFERALLTLLRRKLELALATATTSSSSSFLALFLIGAIFRVFAIVQTD
jgi:hypothetical protein